MNNIIDKLKQSINKCVELQEKYGKNVVMYMNNDSLEYMKHVKYDSKDSDVLSFVPIIIDNNLKTGEFVAMPNHNWCDAWFDGEFLNKYERI